MNVVLSCGLTKLAVILPPSRSPNDGLESALEERALPGTRLGPI
jgi:hypothetical protein